MRLTDIVKRQYRGVAVEGRDRNAVSERLRVVEYRVDNETSPLVYISPATVYFHRSKPLGKGFCVLLGIIELDIAPLVYKTEIRAVRNRDISAALGRAGVGEAGR